MLATLKKQELPELPYDYDALEPVISGKIMELHHSKHHQGYINNFNMLAEKAQAAIEKNDIAAYIALQPGLKFNGGGHINHSLFWESLAPISQGGGEFSSGILADEIMKTWGSLEEFIKAFNARAAVIPGSGWCWLAYDKPAQQLVITTCANQDPVSMQGLNPLLGIDVWEHAYYLQYENRRPEYLKEIWKMVNWRHVAERYGSVID